MVAIWKTKEVEEISKKISEYKVIGLVSIEGIPSKQFQRMRKKLKGDAELKVTKNNIIRRAFEKTKLNDLESYIDGPTGLVYTNLDPFGLSKILESTKISAPPKAGNIAPKDIIVPAGDTPFKPGPIIGELQNAKIKAKIQGGKIVVTEDSLVAKEGDAISAEVANVLSRLGIEPMTIGLDISAAYEAGMVYSGDILKIDEKETISKIQNTYQSALNLAFNTGIYNSDTIKVFIGKAFSDAISLAINAEVINKETIKIILSKANVQASVLNSILSGEPLPQTTGQGEQENEKANEDKEEKPKEEEKSSEEDAASGLANLFG